LQSSSVGVPAGKSEHNFYAQVVPETNLHFPSPPLIFGQLVSFPGKSAQFGNGEATHPAPVVTHPAEKASQAESLFNEASASVHAYVLQVVSHLHFLLNIFGVLSHVF
jgi:hypothetical protein